MYSKLLSFMHITVLCMYRFVNAEQLCKYAFSVPNSSGSCQISDPEINAKLSQIISEMDASRFQQMTRNSDVDAKLAKMDSLISKLAEQVLEVQQQTGASAGQATSGMGNKEVAALQKMIMDTKDNFVQSVHNIENKLFNLSSVVKASSIGNVKVKAAIEAEIQKQATLIDRAMDKINELGNDLKTVSSTRGLTAAMTPQGINSDLELKVENLARQLEASLKDEEKDDLHIEAEINGIKTSVQGLSTGMDTLKTESQNLSKRLDLTENHTDRVVANITQSLKKTQEELKQTVTEVSDLNKETQSIQSMVQTFTPGSAGVSGSQAMKNELQNMRSQINALTTQTSSILNTLSEQTAKISQMENSVGSLSKDQITKLEALTNSAAGTSSYSSELKELKDKVDHLIKQVLPVSSASGSGSKKTTNRFPFPGASFTRGNLFNNANGSGHRTKQTTFAIPTIPPAGPHPDENNSGSRKSTKHPAFAVPTIPPFGVSRQPIVINPVGGFTFAPYHRHH